MNYKKIFSYAMGCLLQLPFMIFALRYLESNYNILLAMVILFISVVLYDFGQSLYKKDDEEDDEDFDGH
jgi:hypothetical protein